MSNLVRSVAALLLALPNTTLLLGQQRVADNSEVDRTALDLPARLAVQDTPLADALKRLHLRSGVALAFSPSSIPPR